MPGATARADVDLTLTAADTAGFGELDELLDRVIRLAEHRQTLAPATQPEVRLFRRWISSQVRGQATGDDPEPWPGLPTQVAASPAPAPDWDVDFVRRSASAVVAADELNRVLAASPAALELLGWDEDLVGRRIVEIVPVRLREGHIAGFTRHLLTGESTILDRAVLLPALRRDGTEVDVRLLVQRTLATDGRPVFTATLEPVAAPAATAEQRA
jgi:PAS domain S-box-containing protein